MLCILEPQTGRLALLGVPFLIIMKDSLSNCGKQNTLIYVLHGKTTVTP